MSPKPTKMKLSKLTPSGISGFKEFLEKAGKGMPVAYPYELLSPPFAEIVGEDVSLEALLFETQFELAEYLVAQAPRLNLSSTPAEVWTWLAVLYLPSLIKNDGKLWRVGQESRYVFSTDYKIVYKHLIAAPYTAYRVHGAASMVMLAGRPSSVSEALREIGARRDLLMSKGLIEAAQILYLDKSQKKLKKGDQAKNRSGSVRRLVSVAQQLDLTFDLFGMNAKEILDILPQEFLNHR